MTKVPASLHSRTAALRTYTIATEKVCKVYVRLHVSMCVGTHLRVRVCDNTCISCTVLFSRPVYIMYIIPLCVFVLCS